MSSAANLRLHRRGEVPHARALEGAVLYITVLAWTAIPGAFAGGKDKEDWVVKPFSLKDKVFSLPQRRLHAWTAADFPTPGKDADLCFPRLPSVVKVPKYDPRGPWICDPESLLNASAQGKKDARLFDMFVTSFTEQFSPLLYSEHWGMYLAVAVVSETIEPLPEFAIALAKRWGETPRNLLIVVRADGPPAVELAGTLRDRLSDEALKRIMTLATSFADQGALAYAVQLAVREVILEVEGTYLREPANSGAKMRQVMLADWSSKYQKFELWENNCGERRCLELLLDEVRQLSDRYEAYYHEAMVYPALNALGPELGKRVLVLGGGDGGVATYALKYKTVERVVVVELDMEVVNVSKKWFPAVAAGYDDPRCELINTDALAWVQSVGGEGDAKTSSVMEWFKKPFNHEAKFEFDVVIIDFTDEPVEGAWNQKFFESVKTLLAPHGILVQNLGTISSGGVKKLLRLQQQVFKQVYPINTAIPDYMSPYLLVMSTDVTDLAQVDVNFWEQQNILPKYYSPALHPHLLIQVANFQKFLDMPIPSHPEPARPVPMGLKDGKFRDHSAYYLNEQDHLTKKLKELTTPYNKIRLMTSKKGCKEDRFETCSAIELNSDFPVAPSAFHVHECTVYPAMNILGSKAENILILGGGSGGLAKHILHFPSVERVTIVEIDKELVSMVTSHGRFPELQKVLTDPRVEVIIDNVYTWIQSSSVVKESNYDAIFLDLSDELWREAVTTSRVPRMASFYKRLLTLLKPHGLLLQDLGTLSSLRDARQLVNLHRAAAFPSTWVLNYGRLPDNMESNTNSFELDGIIRRPPRFLALSSRALLQDPLDVDWTVWEKLKLKTSYYHASLHHSLFILPAEVHRDLDLLPPRSKELNVHRARGTGGEL